MKIRCGNVMMLSFSSLVVFCNTFKFSLGKGCQEYKILDGGSLGLLTHSDNLELSSCVENIRLGIVNIYYKFKTEIMLWATNLWIMYEQESRRRNHVFKDLELV